MIETLKAFTALTEEFVELLVQHDPVAATEAGIHDYDDRLPDDSPDGLTARAAWLRDLEQRLVTTVPWDELPLEAKVDFALLRSRLSTLRAEIEEVRTPQRTPSIFLMRAFRSVHLLASRNFAPLEERKESIVARLMAIPDYLESSRANLTAVPPVLLEAGIDLAARGPAYVDDVVRRLLRQYPGEAERLEHAGSIARGGFLKLHDHLDRELRTTSGGTFALSERWMNFRLEREHLLELTCADVEALAREQLSRVRAQLEAEARRLDPKRDWRERVEEGRQRRPEANWLAEAYTAEIDRARRFVAERGIVAIPAGEKLELAETPIFDRREIAASGYEGPAPLDGDTVGHLLVTPIDPRRSRELQARALEAHCAPALAVAVARDGWPGRHLMHVRANHAGSRLRRITRDAVMLEGWSAYAEGVMAEAGFYTSDPLAPLFEKLASMRRACLAIVDAGLHSGRLKLEDAAALLMEEARVEPAEATALVRSCCVTPTRGAGGLLGRIAIESLRDDLRAREGSRFDAARFHDGLLACGAIPPSLAREELFARMESA